MNVAEKLLFVDEVSTVPVLGPGLLLKPLSEGSSI